MKLEALDHPKTLDFAARLNVELPTAIGYLELLWAFTGKKAPQGNIGKWPDGAIARACYWMGRPEVFILALRECGFIDTEDTHRFTVHDWREHAPGWVRAKLKKLGISFIPSLVPTSEQTSEGSSEPTLEPSIQGKGSTSTSTSTSEGKGREDAPAVAGLDLDAWTAWTVYRKQIGKPVKPVSIPAAQRKLAAFGTSQADVVEQSIANSWQGLFPLKNPLIVNGHGAHSPPKRYRTADELEAEELARETANAQH